MNALVAFRCGKHGPKIDPRGAHVSLGRLLGEVADCRYLEHPPRRVLVVRHFNGEPWPIQPLLSQVEVLERRP